MNAYEIPENLPAVAAALKAGGELSRLRILKVLEEGELCVCHLVELLDLAQPTVSRHLAVLRGAGLVTERKKGRWSWYRLSPSAPFLARFLEAVSGWAEGDPVVGSDRKRASAFREPEVPCNATS
jgi:DNA-binding transcriptional ArsR family regulator